jgi:uncharacterized SAM-binding protein YcdF (DUF218 family)
MKKKRKAFGRFLRTIVKALRIFLMTIGVVFLIMVALSFTSIPFKVYYWLGTNQVNPKGTPDYIVVMGAGGMPGTGALMRSYFAAEAALLFPEAKVIITLPADTLNFINSDAYRMAEAIEMKGISADRIIFETNGTNTYTQANEVLKLLGFKDDVNLLIVTSPAHVYRCILTFKKCGFQHVGGLPAFEAGFSPDLLITEKERKQKVKELGRRVSLRYNMWNYLSLEVVVVREFVALGYYKIKGYI